MSDDLSAFDLDRSGGYTNLTRLVDAHGQLARVMCQICFEYRRVADLAVDPADGKRWDVCAGDCAREAGL